MTTRRKLLGAGLALPALHLATRPGPARAATGFRAEHVRSIGTEGTGEGQFKYIEDFAFTNDGRLLATDAVHAWVQVFDAQTGAFLSRFGGKGDEDHQLEKPEGIAVDPASGNIFVADYNTGFVKIYGPDFRWLSTFSDYGTEPGQNQKSEFMAVHDNRLYMPEAGNHRVNIFDLQGRFLKLFGGLGNGPGQLNNPEAVRFGPNGRMYVTDLKNDRIQTFDKEGVHLGGWGSTGSAAGQFKSPAGLAIDPQGRVHVTEIGNDRVQVFDAEGGFIGMWGSKGSGAGEFGNLHGMAYDPRTGQAFIADTANHRIQVFRLHYGANAS